MPRSCAIGVRRLTGRNSTVIRQATQNATEKTADQLGRETSLVCGLVVGWICSVMASPEDKNVRKSRAVKHALFRQEELVIAQLKGVQLLRIGLHLAHEAKRQTNLRIGNGRGQAGFTQHAVPCMQVLLAAVDDADLPDQQHLGGVLQMRLVGALKHRDHRHQDDTADRCGIQRREGARPAGEAENRRAVGDHSQTQLGEAVADQLFCFAEAVRFRGVAAVAQADKADNQGDNRREDKHADHVAVEQIVRTKQRHACRPRPAEVVGDVPHAEVGTTLAARGPFGDGGVAARPAGTLEETAQGVESDHHEQADGARAHAGAETEHTDGGEDQHKRQELLGVFAVRVVGNDGFPHAIGDGEAQANHPQLRHAQPVG
ncbi:hypothetical protein L1887_45209 [Cichorium endivia]|nr:hypothetical protein L1887_45209 [Cichorium endivia]